MATAFRTGTRVYWHGTFPDYDKQGTVAAPGGGALRTPVLWDRPRGWVDAGRVVQPGPCGRCGAEPR